MANEANIKAVITAEDKASGVLKGFGNTVNGFSAGVVAKGILMADAIENVAVKFIQFGVSSVKAFSESQDAIAQTNAVLKSTAGIAGVTADQVDKLSKQFQKTTKYSDENVRSVENMLLTFTRIGKDVFPDVTAATLDLATALHKDTQSAAIQVGKAMNGLAGSMTALQKSGVGFSDAQKDVIQNLFDTGNAAEAQKMILAELNKEFGGSAEAAGGTFSGSLTKLKNNFNDVQEAIGQALVKGLTPLAQKMADFVASDKFQTWLKNATEWLNINLPIAAKYVTDTLLPAMKKAFDDIWPVVKTVIGWIGDMFKLIDDHKWLVWTLVGAFAALKIAMALEGALSAFTAVIGGMAAVYGGFTALLASPLILPALAIGAVLASIAAMAKSYFDTKKTIEETIEHVKGDIASINDATDSLNRSLAGTNAQADRAQNTLLKMGVPQSKINESLLGAGRGYASGGFTGQGGTNDVAGIVHKGEYVLPQNMVDQGTGRPKMGGGNINININTGALMGNDVEARKFAQLIVKHYNDAMQSKSGMVMA